MQHYKLSQILQIVQERFDKSFFGFNFWFVAEISRFSAIGWRWYCDLIEIDQTWKVCAKSRWLIWDLSKFYIFLQKIKKTSDDIWSIEVLVHGTAHFHQDFGFSIWIDDFKSEYTIGKIQIQKESIISNLQKLGILNKNKNTHLGFPPYNIAVISSQSSQWLKDFKTILENSQYNFLYKFYPASIHGNEAKVEVLESIKKIQIDLEKWEKIDMVAIVRGGGGSSGIVRQDDFDIAKSICQMTIPVMIAVWHTSDNYILDKISKFSAKTPSDAGRLLVDAMQSRENKIKDIYQNINHIISQKISWFSQSLSFLNERIDYLYFSKIEKIKSNIEFWQNFISKFGIDNMLEKWYCVIYDLEWNIINKQKSEKLKKWDILEISIYDKKFKVEILDNTKIKKT